jgi:hypothetical protein
MDLCTAANPFVRRRILFFIVLSQIDGVSLARGLQYNSQPQLDLYQIVYPAQRYPSPDGNGGVSHGCWRCGVERGFVN